MPTIVPRRSLSRDQLMLGATLLLLGLLGLLLLLGDLRRRPPGKSRIDWPAPSAVKP